MSGWLDLTQSGLSLNQKHQALPGAPMIVHCGDISVLGSFLSECRILANTLSDRSLLSTT
jgi:hypothetical protein